jgi:hypothetical protein
MDRRDFLKAVFLVPVALPPPAPPPPLAYELSTPDHPFDREIIFKQFGLAAARREEAAEQAAWDVITGRSSGRRPARPAGSFCPRPL